MDDDEYEYFKALEEQNAHLIKENRSLLRRLSESIILIDTLRKVYDDDVRKNRERTVEMIKQINCKISNVIQIF